MKTTIYLLFLTFSSVEFAHSGDLTADGPTKARNVCEEAMLHDDQELTKLGFLNPLVRYGEKGFLGYQPGISAQTLDTSGKYAIIHGEIVVTVVNDKAEAIKHSQSDKVTDKGYYFVLNGKSDKDINLLDHELTVINSGNIVAELDAKQTWKILDHLNMSYHEGEKGPSFYTTDGWVQPDVRSIINKEQSVDEGEGTYGAIREFTHNALGSGYKIVFNNRPEVAVNLSRKHSQDQGKKSVAVGSYLQWVLDLVEEKRAFTVEVYAPQTELSKSYGEAGMVAGVIGHIQGKLYVIDTIFYPPIEGGERYAKSAIYALLERLFDAGVEFVDTTKISAFAQSLRAKSLSSAEEISMLSTLPEEPVVDFQPFTCPRGCE